jgi:hypothetical protein
MVYSSWNKEDPRISLYHNKGTEIIIKQYSKFGFLIGNVWTKNDYDVRFENIPTLREGDDWPEGWVWMCLPELDNPFDLCLTMHEEFIINYCIVENLGRKNYCFLSEFKKQEILSVLGGDALKIAKCIFEYGETGNIDNYELKIKDYVKRKLGL